MFRTQSSEMRNLSAIKLRPPRHARTFVTFPFKKFAELRARLLGKAHLVSARGYGTCSAMDQSLILGCRQSSGVTNGVIVGVTIERPRTARGSMLVTSEDSVNCVREHVVVTCI
jgi:hypothetical protein